MQSKDVVRFIRASRRLFRRAVTQPNFASLSRTLAGLLNLDVVIPISSRSSRGEDVVQIIFAPAPLEADWGLRQIAFPAGTPPPAVLSIGVWFARKPVWVSFELRKGNMTLTLPTFVPADSVRIRVINGSESAVRAYLAGMECQGRLLWGSRRLESPYEEISAIGLLV
jgi:hypothetical protein